MSVAPVDVELPVETVETGTVDIGDVMLVMGRREVRQENSLLLSVVDSDGDAVLLLLLRKWTLKISINV